MTEQLNKGGKLQISIIALVFFGPLIVASWMYMTGQLTPAGNTNHGALLEPIVNIATVLPETPLLLDATAPWQLIYVNGGECDAPCGEALHRLRQVRLMLGNDMDRLGRIFLHGESPPDKVFLDDQHRGLITISDRSLAVLLEEHRPKAQGAGGIFLVDPLDNLIMYFAPEIDPGDIVDDLKHLLELSRIG